MKHGIVLAGLAIVTTGLLAPGLQAQGRQCSGNGEVIGPFGFTSSRSGVYLLGATAAAPNSPTGLGPMIPVAVLPPGTTGIVAPFVGSNTSIGNLLTGLQNPNVFSSVGRVFADGLGTLYASPTTGLTTNVQVGSYTVTTSCAITVTLFDPFVSTTGGTTVGNSPTSGSSVTLQGYVTSNGTEINLIGANGATVVMRKTSQAGSCTTSSLTGNFTVLGSGFYLPGASNGQVSTSGTLVNPVTTTPAPTGAGAFTSGTTGALGTPFNLLGRFSANGSGADPLGNQLPQGLNVAATYTINADCTGTGTLVDSTGVSRKISFVLVNRGAQCAIGSQGSRQGLDFVFTDPGVIGGGSALLE